MSEKELSSVRNFKIQNQFCKMKWIKSVDLRGVDLDKAVCLLYGSASVYPEEFFSIFEKPQPGRKLNVPAEITIYGFGKSRENDRRRIENDIFQIKKEQHPKILDFDFQKDRLKYQTSFF